MQVSHHAAAHVMTGWYDGNEVLHRVDPHAHALVVNGREMVPESLLLQMPAIQVDIFISTDLHFIVDRSGHDIPGGQGQAFVVSLHEFLPVAGTKDAPVAPHGLRDEKGGIFSDRTVEAGGVKLDELHIPDAALGPVDHGDAVASGDDRVGGLAVDLSGTTGSQDGGPGQEGLDATCLLIQCIGPVTGDARGDPGDVVAQMVLGDQINGEVMFEDGDVGVATGLFQQGALDLPSGEVLVVEDAILGVASLPAQVIPLLSVLIEPGAPFDDLAHPVGAFIHHGLDGIDVAQAVTGIQGVGNVLVEGIFFQIPYGSYATLGVAGIALIINGFGQYGDRQVGSLAGHFGGQGETGHTGTDHQKVGFDQGWVLLTKVENTTIPMRIAVNTRMLLPNKLEGIGWYSYEVLRRMVQDHPEHEFIFLFDRPYDPGFVFGEHVHPIVLYPPARHPFLFMLWFDWVIPRAMRRYKADVFFSPDGFLSLRTKVPTLLTIHDLAYKHFPDQVGGLASWYYRTYMPRFMQRADRIVTVSEATRQDVIDSGTDPGKVSVSYNGANSRFAPQVPEDGQRIRDRFTGGAPYFLYVGAIHPRKNVTRLVRAFTRFKDVTGLPHRLVLLGRMAWMAEETKTAIEGSVFRKEIIQVGYQGDDLPAFYGGAEALVYVSLFEGFGIPIVEAMGCETAVITSDRSSMAEVAGDAALLVDPESEEAIAGAMGRLVQEPGLRQRMIDLGRERKKRFDWDRAACEVWSLLEELGSR